MDERESWIKREERQADPQIELGERERGNWSERTVALGKGIIFRVKCTYGLEF